MPIYIYDPARTETGSALISLTGATPLRRYDGYRFWKAGKPVEFQKTDLIVCWGQHVPAIPDVSMLNSNLNFRNQLELNKNFGAQPGRAFLPGFLTLSACKYRDYGGSWADSLRRLKTGQLTDLVAIKEFPEYGTRAVNFESQYKVHVFQGKIIRAGTRVELRTGKSKTLPGDGVWYKHDYATALPEQIATGAQLTAKFLNFDFLLLNLGLYRGNITIRKLLSAPTLTAEETGTYAKYITGWFNAINGVKEEIAVVQREW